VLKRERVSNDGTAKTETSNGNGSTRYTVKSVNVELNGTTHNPNTSYHNQQDTHENNVNV
jgi:hypothetical protein